ncbi:hypothetical protein L873DRAFT_1439878 [Choiromyces venosus 120613-1]|uniref:Uncharacterized protein n=1 Tax=Choiromyces venosus 120613-1 TaxID=1336337 RepID=A0A3N4JAN7_9PEZI|nr:hypothetical protein L873DRAFT_1439878 [Choiromyces venosus 120613-1]
MSFGFCDLDSSRSLEKSKPPTNPNTSYLESSPDEACPPSSPRGSHNRLLLAQLLHSNKHHPNNEQHRQEQLTPPPLHRAVQVLHFKLGE